MVCPSVRLSVGPSVAESCKNKFEEKNLEIGVSTKLIVTARIRGNVLRKKKILKKKNFEEKKIFEKKYKKKKILKKKFEKKI